MYDPNIGRWLEQDPIGFEAGDTDLYRYVYNDPTYLIDPSGLWAFHSPVWDYCLLFVSHSSSSKWLSPSITSTSATR